MHFMAATTPLAAGTSLPASRPMWRPSSERRRRSSRRSARPEKRNLPAPRRKAAVRETRELPLLSSPLLFLPQVARRALGPRRLHALRGLAPQRVPWAMPGANSIPFTRAAALSSFRFLRRRARIPRVGGASMLGAGMIANCEYGERRRTRWMGSTFSLAANTTWSWENAGPLVRPGASAHNSEHRILATPVNTHWRCGGP